MAEQIAPKRLTWLVITGGLVMAVPMYAVVAWQLRGGGPLPVSPYLATLRPWFAVVAGVCLVGSVLVARLRMSVDTDALSLEPGSSRPPEPEMFTLWSIVASALAETSAVLGFVLCFLGGPPQDFVWYGAGTLIVLLGVILPHGLRYWRAWEDQQRREGKEG
jgi:hypothetical protein